MNRRVEPLMHEGKTRIIIGAFYRVYNKLGAGFLEKVYENALVYELRKQNMHIQQQSPINVYYSEQLIGEYFADLLIDGCIIVELKVAKKLHLRHEAQLLNYLKATDIEVGLLVNFGTKLQFKRKVYSNKHKS